MPAPPRYNRAESAPRHLGRIIRHGPNGRERPIEMNIQDGGSVRVHQLLLRPKCSTMHVTAAEILSISRERDSLRKLRLDLQATRDGPKIRFPQRHTLTVERNVGPQHQTHHRYLIHGTGAPAASDILKHGMRQIRNIRELHFAELEYDGRHSQYIMGSRDAHSKRAWLVIDTQLASGLFYTFSTLPNGVVIPQ